MEPIKSKKARTALLYMLGLLALLIALMATVGDFPEEVILITPEFDIAGLCALCFMLACVAGFLCIFIKSIRRPVLITVCVGTVVLLIAGCLNFLAEKISYKVAKRKVPVERLCVITNHNHVHHEYVEEDEDGYQTTSSSDNWNMSIRFLDNEHEEVVSERNAIRYWDLEEGDTCYAYVRKGLFGMEFITYMKPKKKPLNLGEEFQPTDGRRIVKRK